MKSQWIFPVILVACIAEQACSQNWKPDDAVISKLESSIKLGDIANSHPTDAPLALSDYARYYTTDIVEGRQMIRGEFVRPYGPPSKPAGIYVVSKKRDFPLTFHGGCSVMNVLYDVEAARIVTLKCNGYA
jgi:hypothetical protein